MRVVAVLAGLWACLLVEDAGVDASPCCGLAAVAVGSLAFAGVRSVAFYFFYTNESGPKVSKAV